MVYLYRTCRDGNEHGFNEQWFILHCLTIATGRGYIVTHLFVWLKDVWFYTLRLISVMPMSLGFALRLKATEIQSPFFPIMWSVWPAFVWAWLCKISNISFQELMSVTLCILDDLTVSICLCGIRRCGGRGGWMFCCCKVSYFIWSAIIAYGTWMLCKCCHDN